MGRKRTVWEEKKRGLFGEIKENLREDKGGPFGELKERTVWEHKRGLFG